MTITLVYCILDTKQILRFEIHSNILLCFRRKCKKIKIIKSTNFRVRRKTIMDFFQKIK